MTSPCYCYALFSPDNVQQKVTESLSVALRSLKACPEGWAVEEFFNGTTSTGMVATRIESRAFDTAIDKLIDLLDRKDPPAAAKAIREARMGLAHSSRLYAERKSEADRLSRLPDANAVERLLSFAIRQARTDSPDAALWAQAAQMASVAQSHQRMLLQQLGATLESFVTGEHYETKNPYSRPYVRAGLEGIREVIGFRGDWTDALEALRSDGFVIYSESESVASDGEAGYWSSEDGWGAASTATVYSRDEIKWFDLPISAKQDAEWVHVDKIAGDRPNNRQVSERTGPAA